MDDRIIVGCYVRSKINRENVYKVIRLGGNKIDLECFGDIYHNCEIDWFVYDYQRYRDIIIDSILK